MLEKAFTAAVAAAFFAGGVSNAAASQRYETVYHAPTRVNLGGRPVTADIKLASDRAAAENGYALLVLITDVTDFIADVETDLEKWVAAHQDECGQRWKAGKPVIDFPDGAIRFALDLELDVYHCGWNGKSDPALLTSETGSVSATLTPSAVDGRLQAALSDFSIGNRGGVSKYLPLEFVTRAIIEQEIKKLNENPKFYKAPLPFADEGFGYAGIKGRTNKHGRVIIIAHYSTKGDAAKVARVVERVRAEGISAEGVKQ
ncbi:MAG: hypothetical protein KDD85_14025 [Parvularculaceae bacterium]|nr:hypothetical protein [Parvularculaceae bacterium]